MLLVTGWSDKAEGIAFLADTDDAEEACRQMAVAWNAQFDDQVKLVTGFEGDGEDTPCTCLVLADIPDSDVIDDLREYSDTGWYWKLTADAIEPGKVAQNMPW